MNVDYRSNKTPEDYVCAVCGTSGVKLWREYQVFDPQLLCAQHAAEDQGKDIDSIDAEGIRFDNYGYRTDQIGWYVPAVPDEEGAGYWEHTSVPDDGCKWWKRLPTLAK